MANSGQLSRLVQWPARAAKRHVKHMGNPKRKPKSSTKIRNKTCTSKAQCSCIVFIYHVFTWCFCLVFLKCHVFSSILCLSRTSSSRLLIKRMKNAEVIFDLVCCGVSPRLKFTLMAFKTNILYWWCELQSTFACFLSGSNQTLKLTLLSNERVQMREISIGDLFVSTRYVRPFKLSSSLDYCRFS